MKVARRAARQFGVFHLRQALRDGMTKAQMKQRVRCGRVRRVLPGVYVIAGSHDSWKQRLMAALLWAGDDAVLSGRSAAGLVQLEGFEQTGDVELSLPRNKRVPVAWIVVHRIDGGFDWTEVARSGPFPITSVTRTIFDLAALVDREKLEFSLEDALRRHLTSIERLEELLSRRGGKGAAGTRALGELVAERGLDYVPTRSQLEVRMNRIFRRCNLPPPEREHHARLPDDTDAFIDFAYPDLMLGVEVDGYATHGSLDGWEADMHRENLLKELGWTILRFSWNDVRGNPQKVEATIRRFLNRRLPFSSS